MNVLLDKLEALGFYKYADPEVVPVLKERFLQGNGFLFEEQTGRVYPFDFEFLAEGGVQKYLEELSPFLRLQGILLGDVTQVMDPEGNNYSIEIDGKEHIIFLESEFDRAETWGLTAVRTSMLVNDLLRRVNSDEVFYMLTTDQDSRLVNPGLAEEAGVFLTLDLFRAISESGLTTVHKQELIWLLDESVLQSMLRKS